MDTSYSPASSFQHSKTAPSFQRTVAMTEARNLNHLSSTYMTTSNDGDSTDCLPISLEGNRRQVIKTPRPNRGSREMNREADTPDRLQLRPVRTRTEAKLSCQKHFVPEFLFCACFSAAESVSEIYLTSCSAARYSALWKSENICTLEKRAVTSQLQHFVRRI